MATPTTTSRINTNYGITYGFTDNSGLTIGEDYSLITTALGTSSITGTVSYNTYRQNTYLNIIPTQTTGGTFSLNINATSSSICDTLTVMITGPISGTLSMTYAGNIKGNAATNTVSAGKYGYLTGIYNGTVFISEFSSTV